MKIKRLRLLTLGLAVLATGTLLTACGSKQSSANNGGYQSELKQSKTLTIGLEGTYPPYSYRKNGKLTGFEVDLGKTVAKRLGLKAQFVPTKWDSLVAGLGSGKFDTVLNNITQTPERKKQYLFSTPYVYSKYVLITAKKNTSIQKLSDVKGKKLAEGTGTDNAIVAKKLGATISPSGEFATTLDLVKEGRADATINAESALLTYKKSNDIQGLKYRVLTNQEQAPAKISALFNQKSPKLQAKFNRELKQLRQDGTLKKLSVKYFGSDITTK
ncbi:transporter substrate-binding domain-containing protein [Levilactobacillus zymae]|uniref:ABC-type amino acid transport/signal transduction system, periplasmic component/domain n=1 Tax=Levilactobacillus zymae TaxID=267363 RepID=A0A1Y6JXI3_9LACO|nr:transporter substrate-binding domain-containing protein [Levilactobacillus zymae]SMS13563.1 ABC-type amino acid transport/signal transduction system, periplasmic component/domain [Levilactobacillus zymae]